MALEIVADTPGLWRAPEWKSAQTGQEATPGLYALIIGISAYPHLDGGAAPAPETYNMGQLYSSATTAAAVFDWLRNDFHHTDLPVVWCQLLLSPTEVEKAKLDAQGLSHFGGADNDNLRRSIQRWTGNVPTAAPASQQSRTLFFFSGHGVLANWKPLLLPSDYLDPSLGNPHFENCINTWELHEWMEQSPVIEHLALIDACQNQFSPLASKGAAGNSCFPIQTPGGVVPRTAAALTSTSPNAVAYQVVDRPYTFFGEAVLEALRGIGGVSSDTRLVFRELVDYVKPRVNALLKEAGGTTLEQTARPRIDGDDVMVVTEIAPPPSNEGLGSKPSNAPHWNGLESVRLDGLAKYTRVVAPTTISVIEATDARFDPNLKTSDRMALTALCQNWSELHRRFGHEYASHPWHGNMTLYSLDDGTRIDNDGTVVTQVLRNRVSSLVQVNLELAPRSGGVLMVFDNAAHVQRERLAVSLPTTTHGFVPICLNLTIGPVEVIGIPPKLLGLEAKLGLSDSNQHYQYLWELTREADLGSLKEVAARADAQRLLREIWNERGDQVATIAGLLLLIRAGRIGELNWIPHSGALYGIADSVVLRAAILRNLLECDQRLGNFSTNLNGEIGIALGMLGSRGMPFFAESMELCASLLRFVRRGRISDPFLADVLSGLQERLGHLFEVATPAGHFIALAGLPRPVGMGEGGALTVTDFLRLLGRGDATQVSEARDRSSTGIAS